ncbi:hypothetical protein [Mycoplasma suis]|uniref:Uncharacterized protein n=1 Tax=Mycoplasma suis (strain Illinois) TaxID=768700 RepID=F0QQD8_MYCSL|nr:hypothetical protein [Mycoplasma suis]ADX97708.1 hypothetical protein MSU_0164 [Mycoplasma suis str. Illinois]
MSIFGITKLATITIVVGASAAGGGYGLGHFLNNKNNESNLVQDSFLGKQIGEIIKKEKTENGKISCFNLFIDEEEQEKELDKKFITKEINCNGEEKVVWSNPKGNNPKVWMKVKEEHLDNVLDIYITGRNENNKKTWQEVRELSYWERYSWMCHKKDSSQLRSGLEGIILDCEETPTIFSLENLTSS